MALFKRICSVAIVLSLWPHLVAAGCEGLRIADRDQLLAALAGDVGGKTLSLAPGDYGAIRYSGKRRPRGESTRICSADPARPAQFTGLILRDAERLILEDLKLQYRFQLGDNVVSTRPFRVLKSRDITLRRIEFAGDLARGSAPHDNGFGAGKGLFASEVEGLAITGSKFHTWHKGIAISKSRDVVFSGNDLFALRSDGINLSQVENVLIERNHFHDFKRSMESGDHADMIQIWTMRTDQPSRNITIRSNVLNSGSGKFTQSIYISNKMVDRGQAGHEMFYRNTRIENNVIINAQLHGITVSATDGLFIANNTLIRSHFSKGPRDIPKLYVPTIRVNADSRDVMIARNITPGIIGCDLADHVCQDNLLTQDTAPGQPTHVSRIYANPTGARPTRVSAFRYAPGGPAHGQNIGSDLLVDPN